MTNSITDFYDPMAGDYDQAFEFTRRLAAAQHFISHLQNRFGRIDSALDTACGTGVYALALAATGVRTVGTDLSPRMIEQARQHSKNQQLQVEWQVQPMQEPISGQKFDLVLCMGNSLPHLLATDELMRTFRSFSSMLTPHGSLVLHLLNYRRILHRQERIVGITRSREGREFIRFYDFSDQSTINFNLLTIDWPATAAGQEATGVIQSVKLNPYTEEDLKGALAESGFTRVECYGGLDFSSFEPDNSATILIIAGN